jgi:DNA-binding response OmpR family regulator
MNRLLIVDAVHEGRKGLECAGSGGYSLVILDVMMPRMSGMEVLKELRTRSSVPVLMLTARGDDIDRIIGLELGADDYLPKPFNPRELVARIKAIMRRLGERRAAPNRFTAGDIRVDPGTREAYIGNNPLQLTTVEFDLLEILIRNQGRALTREYLTDAALGRSLGAFERTIDVHISNLRKKLDDHHRMERIKTVRGSGYLLAPRHSNEEA